MFDSFLLNANRKCSNSQLTSLFIVTFIHTNIFFRHILKLIHNIFLLLLLSNYIADVNACRQQQFILNLETNKISVAKVIDATQIECVTCLSKFMTKKFKVQLYSFALFVSISLNQFIINNWFTCYTCKWTVASDGV